MADFYDRLRKNKALLGDGAMGTMLFQRGLASGDCPEKFNLENPEILIEIAKLYFDAGAEIIQANTFGASPLKLAQYHLDDKIEEINIRAIEAVREAVGKNTIVAASCGPSGHLLKPYGDTDPEKISQSFERQMRALAGAGVDLICIETMTDLAEALLALKAAKSVSPTIPVSVSMTFDATPRGFFTIMGTSIEVAAKTLSDNGTDIIGSNCGNGSDNMIKVAREFLKFTKLPLVIRPNAGLPQMKDGQTFYPESPKFMAKNISELLKLGVKIVGGCCGTDPAHIAAMRGVVDIFKEDNRA